MVKELDLRPNASLARGFEPHRSHYISITIARIAEWITRKASNLEIQGSSPCMGTNEMGTNEMGTNEMGTQMLKNVKKC